MEFKHDSSESIRHINRAPIYLAAILLVMGGAVLFILFGREAVNMEIKHINPDTMAKPSGYSHAVSAAGNSRTIYIGGQNAIDQSGKLVGKGNFKEQTGQVLENIGKILESEGAGLDRVIKFNIYIVQGQNPAEGFQAFQEIWKDPEKLPVVTVVFVAGLGNPEWLVEIEAIAVVPE